MALPSQFPQNNNTNSAPTWLACLRCPSVFLAIDIEQQPDRDVNLFCSPCYARVALCPAVARARKVVPRYNRRPDQIVEFEFVAVRLVIIVRELDKKLNTVKAKLLLTHFGVERKGSWVQALKGLRRSKDTAVSAINPKEALEWMTEAWRWIEMLCRALVHIFFPGENMQMGGRMWRLTCSGFCEDCMSADSLRGLGQQNLMEGPGPANAQGPPPNEEQVLAVAEDAVTEEAVNDDELDEFMDQYINWDG